MTTNDFPEVQAELGEATARLIRTVDGLDDAAWAGDSLLPGWRRAHVVAHLALNAEGLAGGVRGVLAQAPTPMYRSSQARDADIAELGGQSAAMLRDRLLAATTDLAGAVAALPPELASTGIDRAPGGTSFPAGLVALLRRREVEIHHVDLDAGYGRSDWPRSLGEQLVSSLVEQRGAPVSLRALDADRGWPGPPDAPTVSGTAADLGWWLSGRGHGEGLTSDGGELPGIGAW